MRSNLQKPAATTDLLRLFVPLGLAALVAAVWLGGSVRAGAAEPTPVAQRYGNTAFRFSVEIPLSLECRALTRLMLGEGCQIVLDARSEARISVLAYPDVLDRVNSEDESFATRTGPLLQPGVSIEVLRSEPARLGSLEASRLTLKVEEQGKVLARIRDTVVAMRDIREVEGITFHVIELDTTEDRYASDVMVFEAVLASWRAEVPSAK